MVQLKQTVTWNGEKWKVKSINLGGKVTLQNIDESTDGKKGRIVKDVDIDFIEDSH